LVASEKMLTAADMAERYRAPNARAFASRFRNDRKKPPELRQYPDPINPEYGHGIVLLWSPVVVAAHLAGERPRLNKSARRRA